MSKTITQMLAEISYADDPYYVPSQFAVEFVNFIKAVNGSQGEENKSPVIHYKIIDTIVNSKRNRVANLLSRGSAKTTLDEYLALYTGVNAKFPTQKDPFQLGLYVSDSIENGVKNFRKNLEHRWENSDFLQYYIPKTRFTDTRYEFQNIEGHKSIWKGYGAKSIPLSSILYTTTGTVTMADVKVGQEIATPEGTFEKVTAKSEIFFKDIYLIKLSDNRSIRVSEDHINTVHDGKNSINIVTSDLITKFKSKGRLFIKNTKPVAYPEITLPLDPFTFGSEVVGNKYKTAITTNEGLPFHKIGEELPPEYLYAGIEQRREFIKGAIASRGVISHRGVQITVQSILTANGIADIIRSLGGTARVKKIRTNIGSKVVVTFNFINEVMATKLDDINKWAATKPYRDRKLTNLVSIVSIEKVNTVGSQCISVEGSTNQYLTDDYVRTHNTGVRGAKEKGTRPTVAMLDDLISDEDARSPTVRASIKDTIYKAVTYALHPKNNFILWNGTPFNASDPLYEAVESGAWDTNVFPICEKFPCTEEEFRGSWEDRFNYDYVKSQYDLSNLNGELASFNQELMLRIISDDDRLIEDEDLNWYPLDVIKNNRECFSFYITTDFATSQKETADFSVIIVWAYDYYGNWFLVDGVASKQLMDANIDDLFRLASEYKPIKVGVEVSGQQGGFIPWIKREMLANNIYFPIGKNKGSNKIGYMPSHDKLTRFNTVVPLFKQGKIFLPQELKKTALMHELLDELQLATPHKFQSKHDDVIDAISMLSLLDPYKPYNRLDMEKAATRKRNKQRISNSIWDRLKAKEESESNSSYIV